MENTITISIADCEERLKADLVRLAQSAAIKGGVLTAAEVAELHWRREAVGRAYSGRPAMAAGDQSGLLPRSVAVGGVTLHFPSIAVRIRLERLAGWQQPEAWNNQYIAYLLAHSFDPEGLARIIDLQSAREAVAEFAQHLCCTEEQLAYAILRLGDASLPELPPAERAAVAAAKKKAAGAKTPTGPDWRSPAPGSAAARRTTGSTARNHRSSGSSRPRPNSTVGKTSPAPAPKAPSAPTAIRPMPSPITAKPSTASEPA